MKKASFLMVMICCCFLAVPTTAQEDYTPGPIWRVTFFKIKPDKRQEFLRNLRENYKPIHDEYKRQGVIVDYKVYLSTSKSSSEDWDLATAVQYKDWATLDSYGAKTVPIMTKHYGSREALRAHTAKRAEMAEVVQSRLLREIILK